MKKKIKRTWGKVEFDLVRSGRSWFAVVTTRHPDKSPPTPWLQIYTDDFPTKAEAMREARRLWRKVKP